MLTDVSRLTESPGPLLKHPQTGANYHEGEAIIAHLNYSLGPDGWDWEWLDQGVDDDGSEVWVLGKLTARVTKLNPAEEGVITTASVKTVRGYQPIGKKKDGSRISIGNDYKGADTDALKRAARLLGVGLDAWAKAPQQPQRRPSNQPTPIKPQQQQAQPESDAIVCSICESELHGAKFKDGTVWSAADLAEWGMKKHGAVLCMPHYRGATAAKKAAEGAAS